MSLCFFAAARQLGMFSQMEPESLRPSIPTLLTRPARVYVDAEELAEAHARWERVRIGFGDGRRNSQQRPEMRARQRSRMLGNKFYLHRVERGPACHGVNGYRPLPEPTPTPHTHHD